MTHIDQVALMRRHLTQHEYAEAVHVGRAELARGCDSSELLVLLAAAVQLGDGRSGTLDEPRQWLERAAHGGPRNVDASLEFAHFLDAVVDEQQLAKQVFECAAMQALEHLERALAGLVSTGNAAPEVQRRIAEVLQTAPRAFVLQHVHVISGGEDEDIKLIGVYSTESQAVAAIGRVSAQAGFRDHPEGFHISALTLNKDQWAEGFISAREATEGS